MEINDHWISYVYGAFALSNVSGPSWAQGKPHAVPEGAAAVEATTAALAQAMRTPPRLTVGDAEVLCRTGTTLWQVLSAVANSELDEAGERLNELLDEVRPKATMTKHGPAGNWHLHFTSAGTSPGLLWATDITVATAMLVGSTDYQRTRVCRAVQCDVVFLDTTRNKSQQFCSNRCQDRVKTANMRERRRVKALRTSSS